MKEVLLGKVQGLVSWPWPVGLHREPMSEGSGKGLSVAVVDGECRCSLPGCCLLFTLGYPVTTTFLGPMRAEKNPKPEHD